MGVGDVIEVLRARYGCCRGHRLLVVGESRKLWKLQGGKTAPKDHEGLGWVWVMTIDEDASDLLNRSCAGQFPSPDSEKVMIACVGGYIGYVIDDGLGTEFLSDLDEMRLSLPLDTSKKKTAAARRFFHDMDGWVCKELEDALAAALPGAAKDVPHVLPWMRFLEYHEIEGALPPHTDALVRCKETGRDSTHTLLLYGSDCGSGGETVLLASDRGTGKTCACPRSKGNEGFSVSPVYGRIFCFPHQCLHEGRPTAVVPKIVLRAEVILNNDMCKHFSAGERFKSEDS